MLDTHKNRPGTRLLDLATILALLYLCQIVPHGHFDVVHEAEDVHVSPKQDHHAHQHDDRGQHNHDHDAPDTGAPGHHHHEVAQHLDSHFVRVLMQEQDEVPSEPIPATFDCETQNDTVWVRIDGPSDSPPTLTLIASIAPRGPPLIS